MYAAADAMEFERAAAIRDRIEQMRESVGEPVNSVKEREPGGRKGKRAARRRTAIRRSGKDACRGRSGACNRRLARRRQFAVSTSPIEPLSVASAMESSGVGSRLMITSRAPRSLAARGRSAAGVTTSDEPIARNRSASRDQRAGFHEHFGGQRLAEGDGGVLEAAAAFGASGHTVFGKELRHERLDVEAGRAIEAGGAAGGAVQFEHAAAAGAVDAARRCSA